LSAIRIAARVEADGVDISDLLIQQHLAVLYDGGTKVKDWCE
jgi:endonuclease YncB( thermonuclease family)